MVGRSISGGQEDPEEDAELSLVSGDMRGRCGQTQLTSFSPQMWLMVETEAGLEAGPMTETTPLGRI